jgi:hypothetical protein
MNVLINHYGSLKVKKKKKKTLKKTYYYYSTIHSMHAQYTVHTHPLQDYALCYRLYVLCITRCALAVARCSSHYRVGVDAVVAVRLL